MNEREGREGGDLVAVLRQAVLELPPAHARRLAAALSAHQRPSAAARAAAAASVPVASARAHVRRLLDAWGADPSTTGSALALALRAGAEATQRLRASQSIDVVWTGPASPEVPVKLTGDVLRDVVRSAADNLVLVSFAAYRVPGVVEEIAAAARRGVEVRIVLEGAEAEGGTLRFAASGAFADLHGAVSFYEWPAAKRPSPAGSGHAAMHAKAAIADEHTALITSANLTGNAIATNMELGLVVRGGPVPVRLARHFRQLMVDEVLCVVTP